MAKKLNHGTKAKTLRKFGFNEKYQYAMYALDQYGGTVLSCRYAVPRRLAATESRTQLEKIIEAAVVETIMRHPMLRVGMINGTSKTPSWIQLQSLELTQHIKWVYLDEKDHFEEAVQQVLRTQLDDDVPEVSDTQPGWRVTIVRQSEAHALEVILAWDHAQFDGMGAKVWHEDFLELLNTIENGAYERTGFQGHTLNLPEAAPILPAPIETVKHLPSDLKFLANLAWKELRRQSLNHDMAQALWCPIVTSPHKTQFRTFFIDAASLSTLLALCRQNKTTLTGLINSLLLIAFTLRVDSPAFQSSTVLDHRRNLPPPPPDAKWGSSDRAVSNYVTELAHRHEADLVARIRSKLPANSSKTSHLSSDLQRELWAIAAQNRLEIVRKLDSGLRNDLLGVSKYVPDCRKLLKDMAKKPRRYSWLVTNVGVLNGGTCAEQEWSIERAVFGLSAEIPAAAIEFATVSVRKGGMCVSANWASNAVDVGLGDQIVGDLEGWMRQLASQS